MAALELAELHRLREHFLEVGFTVDGVAAQLGVPASAALARGELVPALRRTRGGSALETYVRLFLLGEPVPAAATVELPEQWVDIDGEQARARLDVRPYATAGTVASAEGGSDWYVVSDLGTDVRPGPLPPDHVLGVGGASLTLAGATVRPAVGTALDLGTGCGIQALHLAEHAGRVTATDSNARALRMTRWSAALSGQRPPELLEGDLWEPVAGRRFDLVVSNPPFVIGPGLRYTYRDSGLPGDEMVRRLLAQLADHLTDGGWGQLLGNWLHLRDEDWRERLAGWLRGTGCDAWVVQREVTDPAEYVAMWLRDSGDELDRELADEWLGLLEDAGIEAIGFGLISLRATGSDSPVVRLEELRDPASGPVGGGIQGWFERVDWLRHTPDQALLDVRLHRAPNVALETLSVVTDDGWAPALQTLVQAGGWRRRGEVDAAGAALIAGCDGSTSVRTLLAVLGAIYGVEDGDGLEAVRDLVETGFLVP